jgi:hypothetical protein
LKNLLLGKLRPIKVKREGFSLHVTFYTEKMSSDYSAHLFYTNASLINYIQGSSNVGMSVKSLFNISNWWAMVLLVIFMCRNKFCTGHWIFQVLLRISPTLQKTYRDSSSGLAVDGKDPYPYSERLTGLVLLSGFVE